MRRDGETDYYLSLFFSNSIVDRMAGDGYDGEEDSLSKAARGEKYHKRYVISNVQRPRKNPQ